MSALSVAHVNTPVTTHIKHAQRSSSRAYVSRPMHRKTVRVFPSTAAAAGRVTVQKSQTATADDAYLADVRSYVSHLWAEDWDSPEDAAYDTW